MPKPMKIQTVPIGDVQLDPENARKHPQNNLAAIRESLRAFGQQKPIVVYRFPTAKGKGPMTVIAGNGALMVMRELAFTRVDVVAFVGTPEQARAFAIADNRSSELSEWDLEVLGVQMQAMARLEPLQELANVMRVDDLLAQLHTEARPTPEDVVPAPPSEAVTKLGDVWELGRHRLACGDSAGGGVRLALDAMGEAAALGAHLCVTDPPWNVAYGANKSPRYRQRQIKNDDLGEDFGTFLSASFAHVSAALMPGAGLYCVMSAQEWGTVMGVLETCGFHWSSTIVWAKDRLVLSRKDYHTQYEPIWYGWSGDAARIRPMKDRKQSDLWRFDRPSSSESHPTMKPVELMARCIRNSSNIGDVVLEPFAGAGSTLMACEQLGRRCAAVELDPKYCDVIVERWQVATGQTAVLVK